MKIKKIYLASVIVLGLLTGVSNAGAWTGPTASPPSANVNAPINEGGIIQTKSGNLVAGGLRSLTNVTADVDMYAGRFLYQSSDRNLKKDIVPLQNSLANILKLEGVSFSWKKDGTSAVGLIAQDVERVFPELVVVNPATGFKAIEYSNLVAPLIEAVKEQQREIELLKAEIEKLKAAK
jgi:hypothetical protein